MDLEKLRELFPVTKTAVYLNNAAQSPLNILAYHNLMDLLAAELNPLIKKAYDRNTTKNLLAKLLGGLPQDYALVTSTGVGIGIVAQGIDFKKGDNVVLPENEHWNNIYPWLALKSKEVEIRFAKLTADNRIEPKAIAELVDDRTRLVAIAAVRFNSGFRSNLAEISKIAHTKGAIFMVDVAQAAGMIPIDVVADGIDVMAGCGFKWLLGFQGTGFLYVKNNIIDQIEPVLPGMFAAELDYNALQYYPDARKFETGTIAYPLFNAWTAGLELVLEIGVKNIYEKVLADTKILATGILEKGYRLITPIANEAERTAIIHFTTNSAESTKLLYDKLIANKVLVTLQGENIRVSPNFFTDQEDLNAFLRLL